MEGIFWELKFGTHYNRLDFRLTEMFDKCCVAVITTQKMLIEYGG